MPELSDDARLIAESHITKAREHLNRDEFDPAIIQFKKAIQISEDNVYLIGLAQAYERKAQHDNDDVFLKLSFNAYIQAFKHNDYSESMLNNLIKLAHKLNKFDELIVIFKNAHERNPENNGLECAIQKISTISVLSIPESKQVAVDSSNVFVKILIDIAMPFAGIFLILMGQLIPKYAPQSKLFKFSRAFLIVGLVFLIAYVLRKILKAPAHKTRKNW